MLCQENSNLSRELLSPDLGITRLTEIVDFTSFYDMPNP